ncbi:inorganic phosphate transporter [Litoribrevibacter albus]|uniref:Phosphate transporter n=1 Tax=Litoribrevibacter albus TaxID=1473156 RepID=A0AA37W7S7_9GAMM|nr:inorganic phosphate transporter [Litoribrevibacter albus]GLQ33070.1 putative phosphate permease [Litoribrevibacter albus]
MEFRNLNQLEKATNSYQTELVRLGLALLFIAGIFLFSAVHVKGIENGYLLIFAAMIGGYMAINIGANDVANNVGPAVGSKALTLTGALIIAALFEAGGALIAGGDVVGTIKKGIIDPSAISDPEVFIWLMMAALLAGALWLNLATYLGAPVSTTHSIVGGVLGAGIAAGGFEIANWSKMGAIAASWVISPVLGGVIAALFLYIIKRTVVTRHDMLTAAKRVVPILIMLMVWAFSTYLIMKGLKKIWKPGIEVAALTGLAIAVATWFISQPLISRKANSIETNNVLEEKDGVNSLFTVPLIIAAALLSFAHGANDVANAIGPLAAINEAVLSNGVVTKASIPLWVMMVGAIGIAIGLILFGPKLIRTVGTEITELDKTRAFCIAMAAAITVIVASQLGLPVSSTHIAVGGVFGVGFLREYMKTSYASQLHTIVDHHEGAEKARIEEFLADFKNASVEEMAHMIRKLKKRKTDVFLSKSERKRLKRVYKEELVKRSALMKIVAAWLITVPASGALAAVLFFTIRGVAMN